MAFDFSVIWDNKGLLAQGLMMTLMIAVVSIPISVLIGLVLALMRDSGKIFLKPV